MTSFRKLSTREKALKINLNTKIYGSFAEIGAGQEVAANFFKAGAASGTIAQTISAYDMSFSDSIYGKCERYVCEARCNTMLEYEFNQLVEKLPNKVADSTFFAFSNTIEALNYFKTNKGQGWLGIRFQLKPETPPNECVIHVVMHDNNNLQQQEAIGMVGVNLIYACYYLHHDPEEFINSLTDGLGDGRIEIDMFRLSGPDFTHIDNRLMSLKLVKNGLTDAALFGADGEVLQASQALYKKNILVLRGRYRPLTHVNLDMYEKGIELFKKENDVEEDKLKVIFELTLKDLSADGSIRDKDFLDRVDILSSLGHTVMISNYHKYYTLVSYLSDSVRNRKVGVVLGINNLIQIFDDRYYDRLKGRLLESLGILFGRNVKLYVYPFQESDTNELLTTENLQLPDHLNYLLEYLKSTNKIQDIEATNTDLLHIFSDNVLKMIKDGEEGWEQFVPAQVAEYIKEKSLFDYKEKALND